MVINKGRTIKKRKIIKRYPYMLRQYGTSVGVVNMFRMHANIIEHGVQDELFHQNVNHVIFEP